MYDTPRSKVTTAGCHEIGHKGHKPSTSVQMIDGMLGTDTPQ